MITGDCRECGAGPQDLPGDMICGDCRPVLEAEEPALTEPYGDEDE